MHKKAEEPENKGLSTMTMDKKVAVKNPNFKRMLMRKATSKAKMKTYNF